MDSLVRNKSLYDKYLTYCCWIFSIIIWGLIIYIIITFIISKKDYESIKNAVYAIICIYLLYLIVEFCSSTSKYLCNKKDIKGIEYQMRKYFEINPIISFYCECYHIETIENRYRVKKRRYATYTKKEKVVTHRDRYNLQYRSSRDVSGLLNLAHIGRKSYIKLFLKKEINFADPISVNDYITQKDIFWRKNRFRDTYMDFREERIIPGLIWHNLARITDKEPCSINIYWFTFFTFLTLAQFYKSYINCFHISQNFTIRKIVSTRYDLNSKKFNEIYRNLIPQINLMKRQINFDINQYNYVNQNVEIDLPTKEEIEEAEKKYKDQVPSYEIYQEGENDEEGIIRTGTIKDNPKFSAFNCHEAPPLFIPVAGNIGLSAEQINRQGTLPNGFDKPGFKFSIESNQELISEKENQVHPSDSHDNNELKIINYENNNEIIS